MTLLQRIRRWRCRRYCANCHVEGWFDYRWCRDCWRAFWRGWVTACGTAAAASLIKWIYH